MENRKIITFPSGDYHILEKYYKTQGSCNQRIIESTKVERTLKRLYPQSLGSYLLGRHGAFISVNFYLVLRKGKKYWVKEELSETQCEYPIGKKGFEDKKKINIEWERRKKFHYSRTYSDGSTFKAVEFLDRNKNSILMEYLEDYHNLGTMTLNTSAKLRLCSMLADFLVTRTNLTDYDLSLNNVMLKSFPRRLDVRLVDFETGGNIVMEDGIKFIKNLL